MSNDIAYSSIHSEDGVSQTWVETRKVVSTTRIKVWPTNGYVQLRLIRSRQNPEDHLLVWLNPDDARHLAGLLTEYARVAELEKA